MAPIFRPLPLEIFGFSDQVLVKNFIVIKIQNKFQRDTIAEFKGKFPQKV